MSDSLKDHTGDKYSDNCDTWTVKVLADAGKTVEGFSNPDGRDCAAQKASIKDAGGYVTDPSAIAKGQSAAGVTDTHAFVVIRELDGSFTVGNIGGTKNNGDSTMTKDLTAEDVKRIFADGKDAVYGIAH